MRAQLHTSTCHNAPPLKDAWACTGARAWLQVSGRRIDDQGLKDILPQVVPRPQPQLPVQHAGTQLQGAWGDGPSAAGARDAADGVQRPVNWAARQRMQSAVLQVRQDRRHKGGWGYQRMGKREWRHVYRGHVCPRFECHRCISSTKTSHLLLLLLLLLLCSRACRSYCRSCAGPAAAVKRQACVV